MPPWPLFLALWAPPAAAVGGALVGPVDGPIAASGATQVVIGRTAAAGTQITVTARLDREVEATALLWPARQVVLSSLIEVEPQRLERLEDFTRPRLEHLGCDALVQVTYVHTVDGCRTYERDPEPPSEPSFAVDEVPLDVQWAEVSIDAEVLQPAAVLDWLDSHGLVAPEGYAAELQGWIDSGAQVVAIRPLQPVPAGTWLPPVRFEVDDASPLPLTLGAADAERAHDVWIYGLDETEAGSLGVDNYGDAEVDTECMVAPGESLDDVHGLLTDSLAAGPLPTVLTEFSGLATECEPCTAEALEDLIVVDLGRDVAAAETWITRLRMRWEPGQLDEDIGVAATGDDFAQQLVWTQYEEGLEFAVPLCGQGFADDPGVCPGVDPSGSGCALGSRGPVGVLAIGVVLVAVRRRRGAALAALLVATSASAADRKDVAPRTEIHAALPVWSTERVVLDGLEKGAPFIGNPMLGVEARRVLIGWRDGGNVGVIGGIRGLRGRARVPDSPVRFLLVEPSVGIDGRHGRFREGRLLSPKLRYGAQMVVSVLDPSVVQPQATVGALFFAGAGAWVGKGAQQWSLEGRVSVVPRTDGYDTTFLPTAGLPDWQYSAGSAVVQLMVGLALN